MPSKQTGGRAPSKYILFMKEHMPKVKAENPDMPQPEVMKKVAAMYKELRGTVNPSVPPSKSVAKASKDLVKKSTYFNEQTKAKEPSAPKSGSVAKSASASKSASKTASVPKSGSAPKTATKSKSGSKQVQ